MTVCKHMMEVRAHRASFIFTDLGVELEWCRMAVGQLDSFILIQAIISIYWLEQLWNSEKADWYWTPRVTNWIEKLRERWAPTTLIDSTVMKHLWGEHPRETRVRNAKSRARERLGHSMVHAWQSVLEQREMEAFRHSWGKIHHWTVKYYVNDVENYHIPQPLWKGVEDDIHTVLNRSPGFPPDYDSIHIISPI